MRRHAWSADAPDLTACDREPIHAPGSIQPHAALLAFAPDTLRIVHAAGDTAGLLGAAPDLLPGKRADQVLRTGEVERVLAMLQGGRLHTRPLLAFTMAGRNGCIVDAITHLSSGLVLLEFECRHDGHDIDPLPLVQTMSRRVQQAEGTQAFCDTVAAEVRRATGFDRVMVYQFLPDGSGQVVAESRIDTAEPFLGLHYPESDIPKQARALYLANWIRMIPDARYQAAPLIPAINPATGAPLDLSQGVTRSVSPVHRQYLANMGVIASMSLSLIIRGKLWGLVACHHPAPRYVRYQLREACELFAEMASAHLEIQVTAERFDARLHSSRVHEDLVRHMSREPDLATGLTRYRPNLIDFIPAAGVCLWIDGKFTSLGETPSAAQVRDLVAWLNQTVRDGVFHTDALAPLYPQAAVFAGVGSGLLALSVSKSPRDYVLWFRPEIIRTVNWAGNPRKMDSDHDILTPRKSFAAWQESVRGRATPWQDAEIEAAHDLRLSLLEVVLRRIDQLAREREAARQQQARLTEELDRSAEQWQAAARALQVESERRAVAEDELSQVLRHTVADQEAERQRISRELHDTLGQSLTLLQLGLDGVGKATPSNADVLQRLEKLKALASDVGREVSRLAWEIRPTVLDDLGIQTAVRTLLETWSSGCGIRFDLEMHCGDRRLATDIETTLYRVLQEALTNVVRHAHANRVAVILTASDREVIMIVEDDGTGFEAPDTDADAAKTARKLGLLGMRERLALSRGSLEIESRPGAGTTLFIRIPA